MSNSTSNDPKSTDKEVSKPVHEDILQDKSDKALDESCVLNNQDDISDNDDTPNASNTPDASDAISDINDNNTLDKQKSVHTDISLVCDDAVNNDAPAEDVQPTSKLGYQLLLVFALTGVFVLIMTSQTLLGRLSQAESEIVIEEGQTYFGLLPKFQQGVPMFSASLAKLYIKATTNKPLQAGTYVLPENPNLIQFVDALQHSKAASKVVVQIIEGKRASDLYKALASNENIVLEVLNADGTPKPNLKQALGIDAMTPHGIFSDNLEGWFAPNTYYYAQGVTDKQILTDLYHSQQQILTQAWENRAEDLPYASAYEALIMASIIEKETGIASERDLVSAVFVNRLNQGMRLQTDPTIIYGLGDLYDGDIKHKDISEKTAYNTYKIDGLPPTPISLPSFASINAAMHPADSDVLYFVATGMGGHKFSKTLEEHNQAVQDYLKVLRQNKNNAKDDAKNEAKDDAKSEAKTTDATSPSELELEQSSDTTPKSNHPPSVASTEVQR